MRILLSNSQRRRAQEKERVRERVLFQICLIISRERVLSLGQYSFSGNSWNSTLSLRERVLPQITVAVCCSVLQCVAVCYSVLQCVAAELFLWEKEYCPKSVQSCLARMCSNDALMWACVAVSWKCVAVSVYCSQLRVCCSKCVLQSVESVLQWECVAVSWKCVAGSVCCSQLSASGLKCACVAVNWECVAVSVCCSQ